MNCQFCNHQIKRAYTWEGKTLGIECWKKIALPEIIKRRQAEQESRERVRYFKSLCLYQALRLKDMSKIRSEFKKQFVSSVITQFEQEGFISNRQQEMLFGTGKWMGWGYDKGMLNDRDRMNEIIAIYELGDEMDKKDALYFAEMMGKLEQFNRLITAPGEGK